MQLKREAKLLTVIGLNTKHADCRIIFIVITFAPGEGQHPLSLYHDVDAEYLCFPTIFCGQRRPSKEERTVPVHYSDIVKWELRSVDRRAAQSVPNIFFKHKKLQMKQISDKVNLAVRRCKGKEKKLTAAEARNSEYLELVKLDEGYYIFRHIYSQEKRTSLL